MLKQVVFINKLNQLRVFPFCDEDVDYFVQLKTTSLLKLWFENYKEKYGKVIVCKVSHQNSEINYNRA